MHIRRFMFVAVSVLLVGTSTILAGARIDLRPTPPVPAEGYLPNVIVHVEVYLVDTGHPQGNIRFRRLVLDFQDSTNVAFPGTPPLGPDQFLWQNRLGLATTFPDLPLTTWVDPLGGDAPPGQITLPNDGEVLLGEINVQIGAINGWLDVMNVDEPNSDFGASAHFGYGQGPDDPVTSWRAFTGELTGGTLELPVVPEPGTLLLLGFGVRMLITTKSRSTRRIVSI